MVVILAMGIGLFAPPFGVGYYAACAIRRVEPAEGMKPILRLHDGARDRPHHRRGRAVDLDRLPVMSGEGCRREGLFDALGGLMAAGARGSPRRLLALVFAVARRSPPC